MLLFRLLILKIEWIEILEVFYKRKLIYDLFCSSLKKLGVEEIESKGEKFNPNCHNAIKVVEDDGYEPSTVCEVFQKGYRLKEVVIRHAVVSVANP